MDSSELMELCRLCLEKEKATVPLFEGEGVDREICFKIGSCLPVKISSDDPLPKKICDDCSNKVEIAYSFWNTATNAEKQLYDWLGFSEPHHETPMDILKTEMVILKDLEDESRDILDAAEGSEEESGGEEDPGGGDYHQEDGSSIDPLQHSASNSMCEAGPSRVQLSQPVHTQPAMHSSMQPIAQTPTQPTPQPVPPQQTTPPALNPISTESPRYSDAIEIGGKRDASSRAQKEVCEVCGKKYVASYMPVHMRTHTGEKPLDCPLCGTSFLNYKALRSHMVSHSDFRPFTCAVCDRKFKRNNELNMHMKIHSGEKAYQCDICEYSCVQKSNLVIHKKRHSNEYKFACDICDKGCYTTQELQKHKMTHMDIIYKCKICNKEFHHKYGLTVHAKKHDPNYEPPKGQYKCESCGKCYVKHGGLKVHMRQHTGVKPYTCDVCGKSVSSRAILEVHSRTHTGEKPHICEVCGKMFTSKRYLDSHIRTHTGEKPFKCNECGKCFTQHSTLIVHSRYHSGKRPHGCPVCGKAFVLRCQLKSHQKSAKHFYTESQLETEDCLMEQDEPDESSFPDAEVADDDLIVASAHDADDVVISCYDDLELSERIVFSCSTCQRTFTDKTSFLAHQKRLCRLNDRVVKSEPSDSE